MPSARRRRGGGGLEAWPGYVDALSTLLMVIIFVLMVFALAQGFLSVSLSSRDRALERLSARIGELTDLLALERAQARELRAALDRREAELRSAGSIRDSLANDLAATREARAEVLADSARLQRARDRLIARLRDLEHAAEADALRLAGLEGRLAEALARAEAAGGEAAQSLRLVGETQRELAAEREAVASVTAELAALRAERDQAARALAALQERSARDGAAALARAEQAAQARDAALAAAERADAAARAEIERLGGELARLRAELTRVAGALALAEQGGRAKDATIAELGQRLNLALAARVEELERYRSDFFGRLRQVLGERPELRIVGDRFVFQSEVLFPPGSAEMAEAGQQQMRSLARVLLELAARFPPDLQWVLRIDGHADRTPMRGGRYANNWELSAARALAVAQLLIAEGVPANRIAAAAFGDTQPLDAGETAEALARNRRIELRLEPVPGAVAVAPRRAEAEAAGAAGRAGPAGGGGPGAR